jgi:hypothetical protein
MADDSLQRGRIPETLFSVRGQRAVLLFPIAFAINAVRCLVSLFKGKLAEKKLAA